MQRSRIVLLATALTVLGAGAACGGGSGGDKNGDAGGSAQKMSETNNGGAAGTASGSVITVTAKEFSFEPKEIKFVAGQASTIALKNGGAVEHDITIENPAFNVKAMPTKTEQKQITLPAGSYTFYCSVPGHRVAGMEGKVTVS